MEEYPKRLLEQALAEANRTTRREIRIVPNRLMRQEAKARTEVAAFNAIVPVGARVIVTRDDGSELLTRTRSEAWMIPSLSALVCVDGISGGYSVSRVRLAPGEPAKAALVEGGIVMSSPAQPTAERKETTSHD